MSETQGRTLHKIFSEFWEVIKVLLVSLAIVLPLRYFIVQPFIVRGASMEPNFEESEYLIVDELSYYFREPRRGETVVFRFPKDPRKFFIKRIIGLPGEVVEVAGGRIRVINAAYPDGFILGEPYLVPRGRPTHPEMKVTLGKDEYFVLGDNRDSSSDSRVWGPLPRMRIMGGVLLRAWPVGRLGPVPDYSVTY